MSATENQFRGVAFGGFNRQDVLAYVEQTFAEHGRQMEQLKEELALAEETRREQAAALADAMAREARGGEELGRLSRELDDARGALAEQAAQLSDARRELFALRAKVEALEPGAAAYARIKERAASIEMEAHLRAQTVLDEAEVRAEETRARVEKWARELHLRYDKLRTDVDATLSHAAGELGRVENLLGDMTEQFAVHDDALAGILDCCGELPPKSAREGREAG